MNVALTIWEDRISPLFDSATMLLIVEVKNGCIVARHHRTIDSEMPISRVSVLSECGIRIIICGAISQFYAHMIEAHGIRIIPFVTGEIERVLDAYLHNALFLPSFRMPGCGKQRRLRYRGGRRG